MTITGITRVILYVENMDRMVDFYSNKLGLAVVNPSQVTDLGDEYWVEYDTGQCRLILRAGGGDKVVGEYAPKFVFGTDNIAVLRQHLLAAEVKVSAIRNPGEGVYAIDIADPEQNKLSVEQHGGRLEEVL